MTLNLTSLPAADSIDPTAPDYSQMTPGRVTTITFDDDEDILLLPRFYRKYEGGEVAKISAEGKATENNYHNLYFITSLQAWALKPIQKDIGKLRENDAYLALLIILSLLSHKAADMAAMPPVAGLTEENTYKAPTDLNGVTGPGGGALTAFQGAPFIKKLTPPPPSSYADHAIPTGVQIPQSTIDIGSDRIAESFATYDANQAFFLQWTVPGIVQGAPLDIVWRFYFGQYLIEFGGNGLASVREFPASGMGSVTGDDWPVRHSFQYCKPSQVCIVSHTLAIWPLVDAGGRRYIVFANSELDAVGASEGVLRNNYSAKSLAESIYNIEGLARGNDPDQSPGFATSAGVIRIDVRRDLNVKFQLSTLGFETDGTLLCEPNANIPQGFDPSVVPGTPTLKVAPNWSGPPTTGIAATIYDAEVLFHTFTFTPFMDGTSTKPFVGFVFTGDGKSTPLLYSYELYRLQVVDTVSPGSFTAKVNTCSLTAFDGQPSSQTGQVTIEDLAAAFPRLLKRGQFYVNVKTTYTPPGGALTSVYLHRGRALKPITTKRGKPGRVFPPNLWAGYSIPLVGMHDRLKRRQERAPMRTYAQDTTAAPVTTIAGFFPVYPPWTVTAIIRDLLGHAGFTPEMINIPELPIRLYPGKTGSPDEWGIKSETGYADLITRLAKNYLGAYVLFEPNAGTKGKWILILPTQQGATPIASFVRTQADPYKPPFMLSAYPADTYPIASELTQYVNPPEYNFIYIECPIALDSKQPDHTISNYLHNPKSVNIPGFPATADPNHADYLGYIEKFELCDASLYVPADGTYDASQNTQAAVDWTVNRLYDFTCHAQTIKPIRAPLAFVLDPSIAAYRPLRFQDPVNYNGDPNWLVRSCSPDIAHDSQQWADYELILPIRDAE